MALTQEQEAKLENEFRAQLKTQFNRGVRVGLLSAYKIVLDKLNDTSKPLMKRIEDVKKICQVADDELKKAGYGDVKPETAENSTENDENGTVQKIEQSEEPKV